MTDPAELHALLEQPLDRDLQSSVSKAAALLTAFSTGAGTMGVSEIAREAGLPKSTAFRLLAILVEAGFVERKGTAYSLGPRLFALAGSAAVSKYQALRDFVLPYLEDLYEMTHETVHLAVLDDGDVFYVDKIYGHNAVKTPSQVGGRFPAQCSALGKAMLAFNDVAVLRRSFSPARLRTPYSIVVPSVFVEELRSVRRSGVAFDREEACLGLGCVAAPIFDPLSRAIAAISVTGPLQRFDIERVAAGVRQISARVSRALQDQPAVVYRLGA